MTAIADFINDLRSNIYVLGLTFGDIRKKQILTEIERATQVLIWQICTGRSKRLENRSKMTGMAKFIYDL